MVVTLQLVGGDVVDSVIRRTQTTTLLTASSRHQRHSVPYSKMKSHLYETLTHFRTSALFLSNNSWQNFDSSTVEQTEHLRIIKEFVPVKI